MQDRSRHLLALEDVLVELLLQALVGQVDAQLLEAVLLEGLEAVDVQDADAPPDQATQQAQPDTAQQGLSPCVASFCPAHNTPKGIRSVIRKA
jgi:hypothetical protein